MGVSRKRIERLTDAARIFTFLAVVALCYLAIGVTRGLDDPAKRSELAARLLDFEEPEGYRLTSAVHMAVSRFAVLSNGGNGQRIKISQNRFGGDRKPDTFREIYFQIGRTIRRYRNLGGFDRITVSATGELEAGGHACPFVQGRLEPGTQEGEVILVYCPHTDKSYTVVASAPSGAYSEAETRELLGSIHCHTEAAVNHSMTFSK